MPDEQYMPKDSTTALRVLVVDDDKSVHTQMRHLMKIPPPVAVEIITAYSVPQAYIAIRESKPHIILLDLNLGFDGEMNWPFERTLSEIPSLEDEAKAPVIAFSGLEPDELWPKSVAAGAYNFFYKTDYLRPGFRGQLMRDMTNAVFLYKRLSQAHLQSHNGPP